ncbi:peptidoglycan recognition family protein [Streptomyces sp. ZYX-F-203]
MSASSRPPRGSGREADGTAGGTGRVGRRALIVGGAAAAAGAVALTHDGWSRLWWRVPGVARPRTPGEVDHVGARWIAASEANWRRADRPDDYGIDRVVVHVTQGSLASAVSAFRNPGHRAAAHYIVGQDGRVTQMIRELDVAYHAGDRDYNEHSVGIEHEGFVDRPEDLTDAMYEASAGLTAGICARYGIPTDRDHLVGHVEVPGTDHTDPGPHWDWDRYLTLVRRARTAPSPPPSPSGSPV